MDQGIIKTCYRKELVCMTVATIKDNLVSSSSTAIDISSKVTILLLLNQELEAIVKMETAFVKVAFRYAVRTSLWKSQRINHEPCQR